MMANSLALTFIPLSNSSVGGSTCLALNIVGSLVLFCFGRFIVGHLGLRSKRLVELVHSEKCFIGQFL